MPQSSAADSTAVSAQVPNTGADQGEIPDPSKIGRRKHSKDNSGPTKIVIREGGTVESNPLLSPSMTEEQAARQRQNTSLLLAASEANLQRLSGRQLNQDQQATIVQIHAFLQQSKLALDAGDLQRGYNLAMKARMLSDDLVRH